MDEKVRQNLVDAGCSEGFIDDLPSIHFCYQDGLILDGRTQVTGLDKTFFSSDFTTSPGCSTEYS